MEKLRIASPDLILANIDKLAELFPSVVTETIDVEGNPKKAIDIDLLRQELSDHVVEGPQERYQLDWPGKRAAAFAANAPIAKALRPVREESVEFDTTKNLVIDGDNLDALKLLQESYLGRVRLIYIDPPYNTGNDFLYADDFAETTAEYLAKSGQVDEDGIRLVPNPDSNGRFHSDWLSMMYPRLKLARNLLADNGVICISIDDNEVNNVVKVCNELFGEANHLNTFVWVNNLKGRQIGGIGAVGTKEYIVCYARKIEEVGGFRASAARLKALMPTIYKGFNYTVQQDERGPYVLKNELYNTNSVFNEVSRPNLVFDIYFDPSTKNVRTASVSDQHVHPGYVKIGPKRNNNGTHRFHAFRWSAKKVETESHDLAFVEAASGWKVYTKVRDVDSTALKDLIMDISTNDGSADIVKAGLEQQWFDYPKPVALIQLLCAVVTSSDSIILDFFAGSGTTAQAVMEQNAADGGSRRFIMVQLNEVVDPNSAPAKAGFATIAVGLRKCMAEPDNGELDVATMEKMFLSLA